ncbi:MAG TPA: ABC transporter substrate-binding protein [Kiloniellaceae bacterium]|nr:ABC transporter substrate-binding protein [Kiloniellaceae bacterium]
MKKNDFDAKTSVRHSLSRRQVLKGAAAATAVGLAMPAVHVRAAEPLKVGTYGGYFEESFVKHIYPDFTKETGIEVESVAEPTGQTWVIQIRNAAKAGVAPADVSMMAGVPRLRGAAEGLWMPLDEDALPNAKYLSDPFVARYDDGKIYGVGAVSWYITLCSNTEEIPEAPTSWGDMWDPKYEDSLGLLALPDNSYLLEITASTFFDGPAMLKTQDGITKVFDKLAEVGPNVRLWYKDEGSFQQALQDGEIPMGQYYHDVAGLAAAEGFPVRSTFPKEGGVVDSGFWLLSKASKMQEEAQIFMNYTSSPEIQAKLSRNVGTAPVVPRKDTDLTEEEFNAVSSDIPPIVPQYDIYLKWGDWISDRWTQMIAG